MANGRPPGSMACVPRSLRPFVLLPLGLLLATVLLVPAAVASAPPDTAPPASTPFVSGSLDLGRCLSALPPPECDTERKGDWHVYLVMGVLIAGLAFIGWRVGRAIRARDRELDPGPRR